VAVHFTTFRHRDTLTKMHLSALYFDLPTMQKAERMPCGAEKGGMRDEPPLSFRSGSLQCILRDIDIATTSQEMISLDCTFTYQRCRKLRKGHVVLRRVGYTRIHPTISGQERGIAVTILRDHSSINLTRTQQSVQGNVSHA
jgi:hypothetical protein